MSRPVFFRCLYRIYRHANNPIKAALMAAREAIKPQPF